MSKKTSPSTELQIPATVTTLFIFFLYHNLQFSFEILLKVFMPLPSNSVGEGVMFLVCPSICSFNFIRTDLVTTLSREWLE